MLLAPIAIHTAIYVDITSKIQSKIIIINNPLRERGL